MKDYWTHETEEAVAKYVRCEDIIEKNEIFNNYLFIPFRKLIDDVFERYHLPVVDDDMKLNILSDLVIRIEKYNPEAEFRGRKSTAWTYCNVLVRCWIADWKLKYAKQKKNVSLEDCDEKSISDYY